LILKNTGKINERKDDSDDEEWVGRC